MLNQELVNTAVQLTLVLAVAFIVWLMIGRKQAFRRWIGLTVPTMSSLLWALALAVVVKGVGLVIFLSPELSGMAAGENTVAGEIKAAGWSTNTLLVILVVAGFKTALSEEIFFRGLIAKRFINAFGFWVGNTVHAVLFGAIHMLIFVVPGGPAPTLLSVGAFLLVPAFAGFMMAFANEKLGNGSIAPGWLMHALGNAIAYPILAFLL